MLKKKIKSPPQFLMAKNVLKTALRRERNLQNMLIKESSADFRSTRALQGIDVLLDWAGKETWNDVMNIPINHGLNTPASRKKAIEALRAALQRCKDFGLEEEIKTITKCT